MHRGGIADKVGNRYEARWIIHQLLGLLGGDISSISIEPLIAGDEGFEFSLIRSGATEWHQCKRQTVPGNWTVRSLATSGVLDAFSRKLSSDAGGCIFVSSDPAPQLKKLKEKVPAANSLSLFEPSLSDDEAQFWSVLQEQLGATPAAAFDFLGRTDFLTISEEMLKDTVRGRIAYWFKGDAKTIEATLRAFVEDDANFNRAITYDDLIEYAAQAKLELKQYEHDRSVPGRIRDATGSYVNSYPRIGAGLFKIDWPAVGEINAALETRAGVVLVSGPAGIGKSAIIGEVIEGLRNSRTLHLAFRVDQAGDVSSIGELGSHILGIADNPAIVLEQLAGTERAVLVIDQADAVSEVSGRLVSLRKVILDLIAKAAQYPKVQLIFSCRTFDLENDHAFRELARHPNSISVAVKPFARGDIEPELTKLGILYDPKNARLMNLLSLPIGLSLAAELTRSGIVDLRSIEHLSQLYERLIDARGREIGREFSPPWNLYQPLSAIAAAMSERQSLSAPTMVLDSFARAPDILQRAGLIVVRGGILGFAHESLFDFLHARAFVAEGRELVGFLLASEQTLFRRTQVRQILAFERELDRKRYLADLEAILIDKRVRPHIRDTVVKWLATIGDPTPEEWEVVARYAATDGLPRKAGVVVFSRKPWFEILVKINVIEAWLSADGDDLDWALAYLRTIAPLAPTEVAEIFSLFLERSPDQFRAIFGALRWIDPQGESKPVADCLITALEKSGPQDWEAASEWDDYYPSWIKTAPDQAARILAAQFDRWFRLNPEGHPFDMTERGGSAIHWLTELAKAAPLPFLAAVLPAMHEAMVRTVEGETNPRQDGIWDWRAADKSDFKLVGLLDLVRTALADAAKTDPAAVAQQLDAMEPRRFITTLHLLLETIASEPAAFHHLLSRELDNPGLFDAGWHMAPAYSAGKAIAASLEFLDQRDVFRAEAAILSIKSELQLASRALKRDENWRERIPDYPSWLLRDSGKREWSTLLQLGSARLSVAAGKRFAELDRKFAGHEPEEPDGMRGGWVGSPIPADRCAQMNDAAWLKAIEEYSNRGERIWDRDGIRGGARELASVLQAQTKADPERFISLLARLPEGASDSFSEAIISGVAECNPTASTVERVIEITSEHGPASPDARTVVRLIRSCAEKLGTLADAMLISVALTGDEATGIGSISHGKGDEKKADYKLAFETGGDLSAKALNSAKGSALQELGHLAWNDSEAFGRYSHVLAAVAGAESEAHIHAALGPLLLSSLKHEQRNGVRYTVATAKACPEGLFTNQGQRAISWSADLEPASFGEIVRHILAKGDPIGAAFAAVATFGRCLEEPDFLELCDKLIAKGEEYRAAAAAVAAANLNGYPKLCSDWLIRFFSDPSKMVRQDAVDCFRFLKAEKIGDFSPIYHAYVASPYFVAERGYFLHQLEDAPPDMADFVLSLLESVLKALDERDERTSAYEVYGASDIILKIYASNLDNPERVCRSLNLIDRMIEAGLMHSELEAA